MLDPFERIYRGFMIEGYDDTEARTLARSALGWLVSGGYVLKVRGGNVVADPLHESAERHDNNPPASDGDE